MLWILAYVILWMVLGLLDLPLAIGDYTWFSSRQGGLWTRIDRWLLSEGIIQVLEGVNHPVEKWALLDHRAAKCSKRAREGSWMVDQ